MGYNDLQCLLIGERSNSYNILIKMLSTHELNIYAKFIDADKASITKALKKQRTATLIFISDEVSFSLELLSDLVWQYSSDTIIVIITEKTATTALKKPFNNTQISKLHLDSKQVEDPQSASRLYLDYLIQAIQIKKEFRRCKHFLNIAEQRCRWLVDSSTEAVAFISRDLHLYANTAYLGLFNIGSIHELPSISLRELIVENERSLFDAFAKKQIKSHKTKRSLILSLKKRNGKTFRANIHVIPSVFKGSQCLQFWVHPLNKYELDQEGKSKQQETLQDQLLIEDSSAIEVMSKNSLTETSMLRSIIKRKEATILAQKLVEIKQGKQKNTTENHILSLKIPVAQRVGVDNLLFESGGVFLKEKRQVFWDKVKITRLLQSLIKKEKLSFNLFIRLSDAAITNKNFLNWFKPGLSRMGSKSSGLIFLLPSQIEEQHFKVAIKFAAELRSFNSKIALDDFVVTKDSLALLKHVRPSYVRLSLPWLRQVEGSETKEFALAGFIRTLEAKNIKVIAPCGFSKDMRRLFVLAGASFCQERKLKTG